MKPYLDYKSPLEGDKTRSATNIARVVQFVVYFIAAPALGYVTLMSIGMGVWGACVSPTSYIGLLGAVVLFTAAVISLPAPRQGRVVALIALTIMGAFWIPASTWLAPRHHFLDALPGFKGERQLSKSNIKKLADHFKVNPGLFL